MPEGGNLSINAYKETDNSVITVADTGVGIPAESREKAVYAFVYNEV